MVNEMKFLFTAFTHKEFPPIFFMNQFTFIIQFGHG